MTIKKLIERYWKTGKLEEVEEVEDPSFERELVSTLNMSLDEGFDCLSTLLSEDGEIFFHIRKFPDKPVNAIKCLRVSLGLGLKEAKYLVDGNRSQCIQDLGKLTDLIYDASELGILTSLLELTVYQKSSNSLIEITINPRGCGTHDPSILINELAVNDNTDIMKSIIETLCE